MTSPADDAYLPDEATGTAPGRGRLTGRRILVVGAGTRPCPDPDPPMGNGRAISVLAAREGAAVACADKDRAAAAETARLARAEGATAEVLASPGGSGPTLSCPAWSTRRSAGTRPGASRLVCHTRHL